MKKLVILLITLGLVISLGTAYSVGSSESSEEEVEGTETISEERQLCAADDHNEVSMDTEVEEETLMVEGLFCAPTGGYTIAQPSTEVENQEVNIDVEIESPDENEAVTQVITPMHFELEEELEEGTYTVSMNVNVENGPEELVEEEITVGQVDEPGTLERFSNWVSSLFSF